MIWFVLALNAATAGDSSGSAVAAASDSQKAEYVRLAEELQRATVKHNWVRVERLYEELEAMGIPHERDVLISAAHAAQAQGDVKACRSRLFAAQKLERQEETDQWLKRLQDTHGPVLLAADLPLNYRLFPEQMPFEPLQRTAVQYAQEQVRTEGYFDGYLPRGKYTFKGYDMPEDHDRAFSFMVRNSQNTYDIRTHDVPTRSDRKKRARIDKRIEKREKRDGS